MSGIMPNMLDGIDSFHCHICTTLFSTDSASEQAPATVFCGHYVCVSCHRKLRVNEEDGWTYKCALCKFTFHGAGMAVSSGFTGFLSNMRKTASEYEITTDNYKMSFQKFLQKFSAMYCIECEALFSTDIHGANPPCASYCGHYWCLDCDLKRRTTKENEPRKTFVNCPECSFAFWFIKNGKRFCYGFMNILTEVTDRLNDYWHQKNGIVDCSNCKNQICVEQAVVCVGCEKATKKELLEKKISPLCAMCIVDFHQVPDHKLEKYSKLKDLQDISSLTKAVDSLVNEQNKIQLAHSDMIASLKNVKKTLEAAQTNVENCKTGKYSSVMTEVRSEIGEITEEYESSSEDFHFEINEFNNRLVEISAKIENM